MRLHRTKEDVPKIIITIGPLTHVVDKIIHRTS